MGDSIGPQLAPAYLPIDHVILRNPTPAEMELSLIWNLVYLLWNVQTTITDLRRARVWAAFQLHPTPTVSDVVRVYGDEAAIGVR